MTMEYIITATLGPASREPGLWKELLDAGAGAFRLNTSHMSVEETGLWLQELDSFFKERKTAVPVYLDLQGSKWRVGVFTAFELLKEQEIELRLAESAPATAGWLPVPHSDFFKAIQDDLGHIFLNDARIILEPLSISGQVVRSRVVKGGLISPRKGITLPGSEYRIEALHEKDKSLVELAQAYPFVRFAISYIKDAVEMGRYRALVKSHWLAAKLERASAIAEARQIAALADETWLCRGDLGAELGLVEMAKAAHAFSACVRQLNGPVLLAGQVLEHMTHAAEPTRSEVTALYAALQNGYSGCVLSDETAIGANPLEAVRAAAIFK